MGGTIAYLQSDGKFKPLSSVINYDMSAADRRELVDHLRSIIAHLDANDAMKLWMLLAANEALKARVVEEMVNFVEHQLKVSIL